jgi:hypothetical protein
MILVGIFIATGGSAFAAHPPRNIHSTKRTRKAIFMNSSSLGKSSDTIDADLEHRKNRNVEVATENNIMLGRTGKTGKAKTVTKRFYGFRSYETLKIALYHALGSLPEPKLMDS